MLGGSPGKAARLRRGPLGRGRTAARLAGQALALSLVGWSGAAAQAPPPGVSATMLEGRVTLSARDASLSAVLTEFGRASGVQMHLEPSTGADEPTTITFDRVAPDDGVRQILRSKNFILVYSGGSLSEVRTYGKAGVEPRARPAATPPPPARISRPPGRPAPPASPGVEAAPGEKLRAQALGHPDPDERAAALAALAAGDDEQLAVRTASNVLESERVPEVLQRALNVFVGVEAAPLEPLLAFLTANRVRDTSIRVQALQLVSERGENDPRVRSLLASLAGSDRDSEVRESAQNLLEDLAKN